MKSTHRKELKENDLARLIREVNEFVQTRTKEITTAIVALIVVAVAAFGFLSWRNRESSQGQDLLAQAMVVLNTAVVPVDAATQPGQAPAAASITATGTFSTEEQKLNAAIPLQPVVRAPTVRRGSRPRPLGPTPTRTARGPIIVASRTRTGIGLAEGVDSRFEEPTTVGYDDPPTAGSDDATTTGYDDSTAAGFDEAASSDPDEAATVGADEATGAFDERRPAGLVRPDAKR